MENLTLQQINDLFKVKVQHKIYTFNTDTIPDYLKIGDTYRQVAIRLNEWKRIYQNLRPNQIFSAEINDEVFFRDTAVHKYLHEDKSKHRVTPQEVQGVTPFCTELFRADNILDGDVEEAIGDIKRNYADKTMKYPFYKIDSRKRVGRIIERNQTYALRPLQENAVECFLRAINEGRRNLLMYAVMRFGKSFTAMQCAKKYADAGKALNFIVITAAKKVGNEWERTIKSHVDFSDFTFVTDSDLAENYTIVPDLIAEGKKVVLFLTLQTLNKKVIVDRHRQVFDTPIDMLFVDETHYGARGDQLGQYLSKEDINTATEVKNKLHATINLHLSGTPYRILQNGEFEDEDIIAFCQFSDIEKAKEEWKVDNQAKVENPNDETEIWDNPYFGFPEMIRFAFNISEISRAELTMLEQDGLGYFEKLFATLSDKKDNDDYRKFVNESDVLTLFKTIDGSDAGNPLLSFLQYEGIKAADLCRHIVCVLPRCTSCDALAKLLSTHKAEFVNLREYEIINISGLDTPFTGDYAEKVRNKIAEYEKAGKKTISLTVGKMLTGVTVEYWDSMFYLKDTMSPQEYDQATFRIQSPYVENSSQINATGKVIKIDKKPQTLLVDFHPARMLYMQASSIDKLSIIQRGNAAVDYTATAQESLTISPIICLNKDSLQKIDAQTIVDKIIEYSRNKSVIDETADMFVSQALLSDENVKTMLGHHPELDARTGIKHNPNEGAPTTPLTGLDTLGGEHSTTTQTTTTPPTVPSNTADNDIESLRKKLNSCIAKMLFYVYLSGERCANLDEVIASINHNERNRRVANNLRVAVEDLTLLNNVAKGNDKAQLVKAITTMSKLSHEDFSPMEKAKKAIQKFNRFSSSEIVTPSHICKKMLNSIGEEQLIEIINNNGKILDIASKAGEFALVLYEMLQGKVENEKLVKAIYSIPTSTEAYEFTRNTYEKLGLCVDNIATKFTSYGLLHVKEDGKNNLNYAKIKKLLLQNKTFSAIRLDDELVEGDTEMQFDAIVGNPPYQIMDGGARASATPIYNLFVTTAKQLSPRYLSMIMPSRWYTGGKGLDDFRIDMLNDKHIKELHDYLHPEDVFPNTNNRGGICHFVWVANYDNTTEKINFVTHEGNGVTRSSQRTLRTRDLDIIIRDNNAISILDKVVPQNRTNDTLDKHISAAKAFGFRTFFINDELFRKSPVGLANPIKCYGRANKVGYVERTEVGSHSEWIDLWKVYVPESNNIGTELNDDNQNSFVGEPKTICTETFLVVGADLSLNEQGAIGLSKYLRTKLARYLLSIAKTSQHGTGKTYRFIPVQDFTGNSDIDWSKSVPEIDQQLYEKYGLAETEITFIESIIKPME